MCFFNKIKTKDVYAFFEEAWQNANIPEFPPKGARRSKSFGVCEYNSLEKKYVSFKMRGNLGKWHMDYQATYFADKKTVFFRVYYFNLTVTNPDTIKAFKDSFKAFNFFFNSSDVVINSHEVPVKKLDDIKKAFYDFVKNWNESGIFKICNQYKSNEELKK